MDSAEIHLNGHLGDDVRIRFSGAGDPIADLRVAVNRRRRDPATGAWEDAAPTWWDVTAAGALARNVEASLGKADPVHIVGTVVTESWTDRRTGEHRTRQRVRAHQVSVPLDRHTAALTRTPADSSGPA